MLKAKLVFIMGILLLFLISCDDGVTSSNSDSDSTYTQQNVICWVKDYEYSKKQLTETVVYGIITHNPLPVFNYLKVNDQIFNSPHNHIIYPGYISYGLIQDDRDTLVIDEYVEFSLNTSLGTVFGNQDRPNPITNIKVNNVLVDPYNYPEAEINVNDELLVSWEYGETQPNFIRIYGNYSWYDENYVRYNVRIDRYIQSDQDSVLLFEENEIKSSNGYLYFILEPYNGPNPTIYEGGNMSGSGSGSLFWSYNKQEYDVDVEIIGSKSRIDPEVKKEKLDKLRESFLDQFK